MYDFLITACVYYHRELAENFFKLCITIAAMLISACKAVNINVNWMAIRIQKEIFFYQHRFILIRRRIENQFILKS